MVRSRPMSARREALRRLGGPVCPVCDAVGVEISVRFVSSDGSDWLKERGKGAVERAQLAPMCQACAAGMDQAVVSKRAAEAERRAIQDRKEVEDLARLSSLNGPQYRQACAEHEDDLVAAERMAFEWGVGNGLFGSRGE